MAQHVRRTSLEITEPSNGNGLQNPTFSKMVQTLEPAPIHGPVRSPTPTESTELMYSYLLSYPSVVTGIDREYERAKTREFEKSPNSGAPISISGPPDMPYIVQQPITPGYPSYVHVAGHSTPHSSDHPNPHITPQIGPPPSSVRPSHPYSNASASSRHPKGKKYPDIDPQARYSLESSFPAIPWAFSDFNSTKWSKTFMEYYSQVKKRFDYPSQCCRVMRIHIMLDTVKACTRGSIPGTGCATFTRLLEETLAESSVAMDGETLTGFSRVMELPTYARQEDRIFVVNGDSLDVGLEGLKENLKTCVLSLGNAEHRGGGWKSGAAAQEESLFRRTNLYRRLCDPTEIRNLEARIVRPESNRQQWTESKAFLPIFQGVTIYTPGTIIFRESEANGYSYMSTPMKIDVLTACGIQRPRPDPLTPDEENQTLNTIRNILARAAIEGCECIILGALGCGAFNNPPKIIAKLFKKALLEEGYASFFKIVAFAIIEDHNSANGNLQPFSRVLGKTHTIASFSKSMKSSLAGLKIGK